MDLFDDVTQYQQFFVFLSKQKTTSKDQFIMQNLIKVSFMRVRCKLMKNMTLKLVNFYKENTPEGDGTTLNPGLYFFVNISKFAVLYFHEFGENSFETYTQ